MGLLHLLKRWNSLRILYSTLSANKEYVMSRCPHFMGVQRFVHLHQVPLAEADIFNCACGELPYLTPDFFREGFATYAVLHALPICRIEHEEFIPRYTLFLITYFTENKGAIRTQRMAITLEDSPDSPYPDPFDPAPPRPDYIQTHPQSPYNLAAWAERGQLGWLDITQPDLPLTIGSGLVPPALYQNMEGWRQGYRWFHNRFIRINS